MGQKVLITAAASGIGLAVARAFTSGGAKAFITDINEQTIETAKQEIPGIRVMMPSTSVQPETS